MSYDTRNILTGRTIPSEGYCDQPYLVINADGSWTCVMTTGRGHEGESGQHVVSFITRDRAATWEGPFDIEPASGPEASWAMPLLVPGTGRIYAFYTYNRDNQREVLCENGGTFKRVDSLGAYAYKYSDDGGRTWSSARFEIPMRDFACDRSNVYGGNVKFFWGVGKPFFHHGAAFVGASKVGAKGTGFFAQSEGVLFRSPNLLTEPDPSRHRWETLPEGDVGLRTPEGGGRIAEEFNAAPMHDGSLYATYRTVAGWSCHATSRDDGRTWTSGWMTYAPGGRRVKNPRAANFVRRFSNGKYLYWFHFQGGEVFGRELAPTDCGYELRNPVFLCGGIERDGAIHWSQPEIALYDDTPGTRMSYPDFIEDDGRIFVSETQKTVARMHELDPRLLAALWQDPDAAAPRCDDLLVEGQGSGGMTMPSLPELHDRAVRSTDRATGAALPGGALGIESRGGFTLELAVRFNALRPWQILFDSRNAEGRGMLVQLTDRGTVKLSLCGRTYSVPGGMRSCGLCESAWETDPGLLRAGATHHFCFMIDGGPKIITVLVDGEVCDGGAARQCGWGRFHPLLRDASGATEARLAPDLDGELPLLRIHNRALFANEAAAHHRTFRHGKA